MSSPSFRPETGSIPTNPGVYRFMDGNGRVIYVGKAKNLRARLTSYFGNPDKLHERTQRMVQTARDVTWTIVDSEYEALQLEFMWIKQYEPLFNVRFRDDKSYPYLAISMREEVPRAFVTRNRELRGVKYFGPYTQAWAIRETLDNLLKVFPVRSCSKTVYDNAKKNARPCILAEIGKCSAPCVGRIEPAAHKAIAKSLGDFMQRGDSSYLKSMQEKMKLASDSQQYEYAAQLRDDITALEKVLEKSTVVLQDQTDADLFGLARDQLNAAVSFFIVRGGRIRGNKGFVMDLAEQMEDAEIVEQLIKDVYEEKPNIEPNSVPKEILIPVLPTNKEALEEWLTIKRGSRVSLRVPMRGDKKTLAHTAEANAKHTLGSYKSKRSVDFTTRADALAGIQKSLGLEVAPLRIECFDISHLGGTGAVGSMAVFEDGLSKKSQYRRFNIEDFVDDTDAIYQVLTRRLKYLHQGAEDSKFSYRPGLLLIDGGLPQVNAAARALKDSGVDDIAICGIAKRLEEVWLPGVEYPVILPRTSDELFLLQRIRDEAHRFAIEAQRKKRSRSIQSQLLEINGLGDKRAKQLLRRFGSATRLREATAEEISDLPGIGTALGRQIHEHLNKEAKDSKQISDESQ
jgi:excinuclease ABC subunit C